MISRGYDGRIGNDNYYISDSNYQDYNSKVHDANLVSIRGYGQDSIPQYSDTKPGTVMKQEDEKKFNWWLLIIGGIALYYMLKK